MYLERDIKLHKKGVLIYEDTTLLLLMNMHNYKRDIRKECSMKINYSITIKSLILMLFVYSPGVTFTRSLSAETLQN
jgi:hypothetical protein